MKLLKTVVIITLVMLFANTLYAQCAHKPKDGTYSTDDGSMIGGRASEAFCSGVGPGVEGDMQNAMSWDGSALGTQWKIWGMAIDEAGAVESYSYFDAFGNGYIDYITNYTGGQFWLSGTNTWGDGLGDFTGTITYYNVGTKVSYIMGEPIGATSNISIRGTFDDCEHCYIEYGIANSTLLWRTGDGAMPTGYPSFLCGASAGELHDVCCIEISIMCEPTSTESSTWGSIKELFR